MEVEAEYDRGDMQVLDLRILELILKSVSEVENRRT